MRLRAVPVLGFFAFGLASQACEDDSAVPIADPDGGSGPRLDGGSEAQAAFDASDANPNPTEARITLSASPTSVVTEGATTLMATVDGGVATSVAFVEGTTTIATDATAPFTAALNLSFVDNGTRTYVARATVGGKTIESAPLTVTINIPANGYFVDPATGSDTANGSQATPFKTIAKARASITAGQTIYLKDGTYDATNQTVLQTSFTTRAFVRGMSPGGAKIDIGTSGVAVGFAFAAGGGISDVALEGAGTAVFGNAGELTITNVATSGFAIPFTLRGDVVATIEQTRPGLRTNLPASCFACLAVVEGDSTVTWRGGGLEGYTGDGPAFFVRDHATLTAENVTIKNHVGTAFRVWSDAHLKLKNSVIENAGRTAGQVIERAAIYAGPNNGATPMTTSVELENTTISESKGPAISFVHYNIAFAHVLKLTNSHLDRNTGAGVLVDDGNLHPSATFSVTLDRSTIDDNDAGGMVLPRGTLAVTGGSISKNTGAGIDLTAVALTNSLVVRGATFDANTGDAIDFNGGTGSTLDLGSAQAGGSNFKGITTPAVAVRIGTTAITGNAKGNTWMPNQQGANAAGQYTSATTLTSATAAGRNASVIAGSSLVVF